MKLDAWLAALHIVGAVLWVGGLTAVLALLHVHPRVDEAARGLLTQLERRLAMVMDLGATAAIGIGLYNAIKWKQFSNGGWLHIKLTVVVLTLLAAHGIARVKIKKFRTGDVRPMPWTVWLLLVVGATVAVLFGSNSLNLMRG